MFRLVFHGGKCCGIKTIHGFPELPTERLRKHTFPEHSDPDKHGNNVKSDMSFFSGEVPSETAAERLERFVEYCDEHRPSGIIEAILARNPIYDKYPLVEAEYIERRKKCAACRSFCHSTCSMYPAGHHVNQVAAWEPTLLRLGFERVGRPHGNSNSGNDVYVYHRYSTPKAKKPPPSSEVSLRGEASPIPEALILASTS